MEKAAPRYRSVPPHWSEFERIDVDIGPIASMRSSKDEISKTLADRFGDVASADGDDLFVIGSFPRSVAAPAAALTEIASPLASGALGIAVDASNLRLLSAQQSATGLHLRAQQAIAGMPIFGSELVLHLNHEGVMYALTGNPFPEALDAGPDATRPLDEAKIAATLERHLQIEIATEDLGLKRTALLIDGAFRACAEVTLFVPDPFATWRALLEPNGRLLAIFNVASANGGSGANANAYPTNPFRGGHVGVVLQTAGGPHLEGKCSSVRAGGARVSADANGDFVFLPNDLSFDEPNLYHCLERAHEIFSSLASMAGRSPLSEPIFLPMKASVHEPGAPNNAFFDPKSGGLFFGDIDLGGTKRYTSRSFDIILHEYGHAVSNSICRLGISKPHTESRAMSEGYSDYFAASALGNPIIGDYYEDDSAGFRNCANRSKFPVGYAGEEHDLGEVWAGYLWDLRTALGASIADALAFESLYYLGPWRSISHGREALLMADRKLFPATPTDGTHEASLQSLFDQRRP